MKPQGRAERLLLHLEGRAQRAGLTASRRALPSVHSEECSLHAQLLTMAPSVALIPLLHAKTHIHMLPYVHQC